MNDTENTAWFPPMDTDFLLHSAQFYSLTIQYNTEAWEASKNDMIKKTLTY